MFLPLLQSMRPKQWMKNGIIFAALVFDRQLFHLDPFLRTLAGFVAYVCCRAPSICSTTWPILSATGCHPKKRLRPLASGRLSSRVARGGYHAAPGGGAAQLCPDGAFGMIASVYLVNNILYSFCLKHLV